MTRNQLMKFMTISGACKPAKRWVRNNPDLSPKELWEKCNNGEYMKWLCETVFGWTSNRSRSLRDVYWTEYCKCTGSKTKRNKSTAKKIRENVPYNEIHKAMLEYIKREENKPANIVDCGYYYNRYSR